MLIDHYKREIIFPRQPYSEGVKNITAKHLPIPSDILDWIFNFSFSSSCILLMHSLAHRSVIPRAYHFRVAFPTSSDRQRCSVLVRTHTCYTVYIHRETLRRHDATLGKSRAKLWIIDVAGGHFSKLPVQRCINNPTARTASCRARAVQ